MGSHLEHPAHSDTTRLTGHSPETILITYISDAHPLNNYFAANVSAACDDMEQKAA